MRTDRRPNVMLYTTDQHRGDHLGMAGHPLCETPNFDAMCRHGAYFRNAYSEIPSTTGARRCMLRGQGSYDCGLVGYSSVEWSEADSLAAVLAANGYHCINVGWRNLYPQRKLYGFHRVVCHELYPGVDDYWEWLCEQAGPDAFERGHGGDANGWSARPWHLEDRLHPTVWTTDVALEEIRKSDPTRPVFIWISQHRPHSPYDPPQHFWDMYAECELPDPPLGDWAKKHDIPGPGLPLDAWRGRLTPAQSRRIRAAYMGSITHLDCEFGRLKQHIAWYLNKLRPDFPEWLTVMTSDHGDMMGDHCLYRKTYAYEGSARIPFLVQYPKSLDLLSGTFEHPVGLQDVMPSILDAVGVDIPDAVTGQSVFDAIDGKPWRAFMHGEHSPCYSEAEAMHYLTDGKEKFIYFPATGERQCFDLQADPQELNNLASDATYAERVAVWEQRLIEKLAARDDGFSDGTRLLRRDNWAAEVEKNAVQREPK